MRVSTQAPGDAVTFDGFVALDPTAIPAAAEPDHVTAVAPFAGSGGGKGSRSPRVASSHQGETTNSQVAASY